MYLMYSLWRHSNYGDKSVKINVIFDNLMLSGNIVRILLLPSFEK